MSCYNEEEALLSAIKAAPEDDAPILVYADWLDEHGRDDEANKQRRKTTAEYHAGVKYLRNFAYDVGLEYAELLDAAEANHLYGDYLCEGDRWEGDYATEEFWKHYQIVTDQVILPERQGGIFSCAC